MTEILLTPLRGRNPLGLFAALGALDVATRLLPDRKVTLHWTDGIDPSAVLSGPDDVDHLIELCLRDIDRWQTSPVLTGPSGDPVDDVKVTERQLRQWFNDVRDKPVDLALLSALIAEGGFARGVGKEPVAKPTHFHFTAGNQKFLAMTRELRDAITADHLRESLVGPWTYTSELPVFGWDSRGERIYALSSHAPASVTKTGVPGADWLGFLGLRFFPVNVRAVNGVRQLETTGCSRGWKVGTFTWPLWSRPITASVAGGLLGHAALGSFGFERRAAFGVQDVLTAPIRRTDQGGYGSFGPASSD